MEGVQRRMAASVLLFFLLAIVCSAITENTALDAVLETKDKLIEQLGWEKEEVKLTKVDTRDALIGEALIYDFEVEINGTVVPIKMAEDVTSWQYMQDLSTEEEGENAVAEYSKAEKEAVLAPFELAGPVELWIEDAKELRLALPHDVDAGALRRIILADGATVRVTGAREVSLVRPFKLPLPLIKDDSDMASSLLDLSEKLRYAARSYGKPLLSLRIVGPTSLVASSPPKSLEAPARLKVKRLSPGAVEIVHRDLVTVGSDVADTHKAGFVWPLPSVNGSNVKLRNIEQVLEVLLGPNAHRKGSFNVLKAKASAERFIKVEFELAKKPDEKSLAAFPSWATKPSLHRFQFEVTAKVDGKRKPVPISVKNAEDLVPDLTILDLSANVTRLSKELVVYKAPVNLLTLD